MRILLIHQFFLEKDDPGGSRFNEMTRVWESQGNEITVISGMVHYTTGKKRQKYKGRYFFKDQYSDKTEVIRCHVSEAYNVNFLGRLWAYFSFVFTSLYAGLFMTRGKYDFVLVTSPPLFVGISGFIISKIKKSPFIFEIRDLWPESAIDTGVLTNSLLINLSYRLEKFIYKKARLINVLTPAFRESLVEKKGVPKDKIIFIPNAADFSLSDEVLRKHSKPDLRKSLGFDNVLTIIYVGAHGVANHLIQVVEVADALKDLPVKFILVGDGMQKKMLVNESKKRNLDNIEFMDPVSKAEVFKYIIASDIGASILKRVDTFKTVYSNKTFDYMACKKPVLMVIDGVSRQLIENADAGLYAEPENVEDIVDKVKVYLQKPELLEKQGEKGYAFAKENFDRDKLAIKYLENIKESFSQL